MEECELPEDFEDFDDMDERDRRRVEDEAVERLTLAQNIAELETEMEELARLEELTGRNTADHIDYNQRRTARSPFPASPYAHLTAAENSEAVCRAHA